MSDLRITTCRVCGAVIVRLSRDVCQECYQEEEDLFVKVKEYLRSHPGAESAEVANALDVKIDQVDNFINSGRLERVGVHVPHQCQICMKIITSGLICPECSIGIQDQVDVLRKTVADRKETKAEDLVKKDRGKDDGFHVGKPRK